MKNQNRFASVTIFNPSWVLGIAGRKPNGPVIHLTGVKPGDHFALNGDGWFRPKTGLPAREVDVRDCEEAIGFLRRGINTWDIK